MRFIVRTSSAFLFYLDDEVDSEHAFIRVHFAKLTNLCRRGFLSIRVSPESKKKILLLYFSLAIVSTAPLDESYKLHTPMFIQLDLGNNWCLR